MRQELGIPEAAAAVDQRESSPSSSGGKKQNPNKKKNDKKASVKEGISINIPPKRGNGIVPERNRVQGGGQGQGRNATHGSSEKFGIRGRSQEGRSKGGNALTREGGRGEVKGDSQGFCGGGDRGWSKGRGRGDEVDLGPFADIKLKHPVAER